MVYPILFVLDDGRFSSVSVLRYLPSGGRNKFSSTTRRTSIDRNTGTNVGDIELSLCLRKAGDCVSAVGYL